MQTPESLLGNVETRMSTSEHDPVALSRLAITRLLDQTGLSGASPKFVPDESVATRARTITKGWDLGGFNSRIFHAALETGIGLATLAYAHTPPSTQLYVALHALLSICIDDGACSAEALLAFTDRMPHGLPQLHPLLDRFVDVLNDTSNHFTVIATREIVRFTLAFMESCALEYEVAKIPLRPGAYSYVLAKRLENGVGRPYANFVWDKEHFPSYFTYMQAAPEMEKFYDLVNDVLSFYKEELAGEQGNFISERGRVTGRGTAGALLDTLDEAIATVQNVRRILEGTEELAACEAAMEGYVAWHRTMKRYKLAELLGEE